MLFLVDLSLLIQEVLTFWGEISFYKSSRLLVNLTSVINLVHSVAFLSYILFLFPSFIPHSPQQPLLSRSYLRGNVEINVYLEICDE
jgi:hypothetical protein